MKPFDHVDWSNFSGCEEFPGKADEEKLPLIGEGSFETGERFCLVLDRTGGCVLVEDDSVNDSGGICLQLPFPTQVAALAFAAGIGEPKCKMDFLRLGFQEI